MLQRRLEAEKNWFVLLVGSRKEKSVLKHLSFQAVSAYVPLWERHYKYASKSVLRQLPILPGYVFVEAANYDVSRVLGVPFVFGFLKTSGSYAKVTESEINQLRRLSCTEHLEWYDVQEPQLLKTGALLEIKHGPLAGIRGRFIADKGRNVFLVAFGYDIYTQLGNFEISAQDVVEVSDSFAA